MKFETSKQVRIEEKKLLFGHATPLNILCGYRSTNQCRLLLWFCRFSEQSLNIRHNNRSYLSSFCRTMRCVCLQYRSKTRQSAYSHSSELFLDVWCCNWCYWDSDSRFYVTRCDKSRRNCMGEIRCSVLHGDDWTVVDHKGIREFALHINNRQPLHDRIAEILTRTFCIRCLHRHTTFFFCFVFYNV